MACNNYIRIDISCSITNPNAPYEVIETLFSACQDLCKTLSSSDKNLSPILWPSLFAFSDQEARNSAAGGQLRGCFLIGLAHDQYGPRVLLEQGVASEAEALEWVRGVVPVWEGRLREHHVFIDEPKMPSLSAKVAEGKDLGLLVTDRHMWPRPSDAEAVLYQDGEEPRSAGANSPIVREEGSHTPTLKKLRSSEDVLKRLRWDSDLDVDDYAVVYLDRFVGYLEIPASRWKSDTSDDEFIPLHRITGFRKISTGEIVWSREARLDKIFNS